MKDLKNKQLKEKKKEKQKVLQETKYKLLESEELFKEDIDNIEDNHDNNIINIQNKKNSLFEKEEQLNNNNKLSELEKQIEQDSILMDGDIQEELQSYSTSKSQNQNTESNNTNLILNKRKRRYIDNLIEIKSNQKLDNQISDYQEELIHNTGIQKSVLSGFDEDKLAELINFNEYEQQILIEKNRRKNLEQTESIVLGNTVNSMLKEEYFEDRLFRKAKTITDNTRKFNHAKIDIYDDNLVNYLEYSILESKEIYNKYTSSLIMKSVYNQLEGISNNEISPEQRLKKIRLLKLAELISHLQINDSANLKKVIDMYKNEKVEI